MPPDDPIFPNAAPSAPVAKPPNGTPAPAPAAAGPSPEMTKLAALAETNQQQIAQMSTAIQQLTNQLAAAMRQPTTEPARPDTKSLLDRIATEPDRVLDETVDRAVKQARESGGQMDAVTLTALHKVVHSQHQQSLASRFGQSAYDKYFKPELDRNYSQLREQGNLAALADPETLKALSDRIVGANFKELTAAEAEVEKARVDAAAKERADLIEGLPIPGLVRTPSASNRPAIYESDDAKLFASELKAATGEAPDMNRLAKVHGVNTLEGYLAATKQPAAGDTK